MIGSNHLVEKLLIGIHGKDLKISTHHGKTDIYPIMVRIRIKNQLQWTTTIT